VAALGAVNGIDQFVLEERRERVAFFGPVERDPLDQPDALRQDGRVLRHLLPSLPTFIAGRPYRRPRHPAGGAAWGGTLTGSPERGARVSTRGSLSACRMAPRVALWHQRNGRGGF